VHTGGTILAVLEEEERLRLLQETLAQVRDLEPWRPVGEAAGKDLHLVRQIIAVVAAKPGVLQRDLGDHLPDTDRRRLAILAGWLEKAGRIRRVRTGSSYALTVS
jgi:hypothetical protein